MMDARGSMGTSIGDVATFAQLHMRLNKIAPAVAKPSAPMTASGAAAPIAPVAVSRGSKATRMEITLCIVLSGL